jgi:ubiquitin thioesterase protein OTUB1
MAAFAGAASEDAAAVNHHDFVPEAMQKAAAVNVQPRVHLLYRPGHYDILYPRPAS